MKRCFHVIQFKFGKKKHFILTEICLFWPILSKGDNFRQKGDKINIDFLEINLTFSRYIPSKTIPV